MDGSASRKRASLLTQRTGLGGTTFAGFVDPQMGGIRGTRGRFCRGLSIIAVALTITGCTALDGRAPLVFQAGRREREFRSFAPRQLPQGRRQLADRAVA